MREVKGLVWKITLGSCLNHMHDARLRPYTKPKDRNKIEEELRSQYPRLAEVKSSQVEKSEKKN